MFATGVRRIGAALAVSALLGVAVQTGAARAEVSVRSWDECQAGLFCVFWHVNGGTLLRGTAANFTNIGNEGRGDKATSVWNRSPWTGRLYDWDRDRECWIHLGTYRPGFQGNVVPNANDRADAIGLAGNVEGDVCR